MGSRRVVFETVTHSLVLFEIVTHGSVLFETVTHGFGVSDSRFHFGETVTHASGPAMRFTAVLQRLSPKP